MKLTIEDDGTLRLPEELLARWRVDPGTEVEARLERGKLVLRPGAASGKDLFDMLPEKVDESGFEKALEAGKAAKDRARDAFDKALEETHDIDIEKEREERDKWR
ncbi:MAG: AbrB/MazE/SpoVT family DNA-binding domain-containing protein [Planctomycetota bacterium]|jgi:antitoxin component of MazEF toxin-antitoxin module